MAEVMPINFPLPSESAVASYNWSDVASGETYITFYPFFADPFVAALSVFPTPEFACLLRPICLP